MEIKFYKEEDVDITETLKKEGLMEDGIRLCNDSRSFRYYWKHVCTVVPALEEFSADWSAAIQYFKAETWCLFNAWLRQSGRYREFAKNEAELMNSRNIETLKKFGFPGLE
jgi:hypothetical protein